MGEGRTQEALARIEAAIQRLDSAREDLIGFAEKAAKKSKRKNDKEGGGSARVMALVNSHEKLREEVADTLRDLDALIEELES